jgi:hypothetical protein
MKPNLSFPLLALFGLTRGMAGIGLGMLLADRISLKRRRTLGRTLFAIGAASTIPLMITIARRSRREAAGQMVPETEIFQTGYGIIDADIEMPDNEPGAEERSISRP